MTEATVVPNEEPKRFLAGMSTFRDYEIMIEYKNLPSEARCPEGMYLMPKFNTTKEFEGVYFVPQGPYKNAVIRFTLSLPDTYPHSSPTIRIMSRFFHPLLHVSKTLKLDSLMKEFEGANGICAVLSSMEKAFDEFYMYSLEEADCADIEAIKLLKSNRIQYDELLSECIQESIEYAKSSHPGMICLGAPPVTNQIPLPLV